jgi:acetyl esterase
MSDDRSKAYEHDEHREEQHRKPNAVKAAIGKATANIRADDDMLEVMNAFLAFDPDAIEKCDVEQARRQPTAADAVKAVLRNQGRDPSPQALVPGVSSEDRMIPGAAGELRARIYTPTGATPLPVIVYFHGGGWVIADLDVYDGGARGLCAEAAAIVVSVDYRRAPEHRFPAAWDDALAAYRWVAENAASFGGDPGRIAIAGESAGGNLAVATAIAARDAGLIAPCHVVSVYPVAQTGSMNTPSYIENAIAQPLNKAMIGWFLDKLLRSQEDKDDPRLNLVEADLKGLPPVTIINAQLDPLRSDGAMLEDALQEAGVAVQRRDYHGVTHEFFGMAAVVDKAKQAQQFAGERLRESFDLDLAKTLVSGGV